MVFCFAIFFYYFNYIYLDDEFHLEAVYRCGSGLTETFTEVPDCANQKCFMPELSTVAHKSSLRQGNTLTVSCNEGYIIPQIRKSVNSVVCNDDGVWSGPFQCIKIECPPIPSFEENYLDNGVWDYSKIIAPTTGDSIFVLCKFGLYYGIQSNITA